MKQKNKRTLTPKLRFPEFRENSEWNEQKLGTIVALEYGSPLPEKDRKGGRFPVIGSNGIVGYHDEAIVDGPAIVVGRKGSAGQVNWIESDCYPIDTTFFVKNLDPESCPIAFLWRLLERSNLERLGDAGAVPGLNRNEVYLLKTYIPNPAEQQKIADCLGSLDVLIAAEGRKLAALRDHKRGLMQQLFPQPGQTQPRLRFPEFRYAGMWNEQKLGEIVELEYGSPLPEKDRKGGRFPVIGSNGIVGYHDEAIVDGPAIIVGRKGSAGQVNWIESDCYPIDTTFFVKNLDPESCMIAFLWRLLERSNLERLGDAGAVPGLNRNEVHLLKTYMPSPAEQQRIAECLTTLDTQITAQAEKIESLKQHKRGLMQQLFPAPEEQ